MVKYIVYNIINLICFAILAIVFNKWWIVLFALLFILVPTSAFKGKCWRVCDGCGRWSEPGETEDEALVRAEKCGWVHFKEDNKDFCPECKEKIDKKQKGV